jgi:hypothetical protein
VDCLCKRLKYTPEWQGAIAKLIWTCVDCEKTFTLREVRNRFREQEQFEEVTEAMNG